MTLALADDSRVSIPPIVKPYCEVAGDKIYQEPTHRNQITDGRVESQVSKLDANKGRFEVRSKLAIAGVRGTHFRVGVNDHGIANEVLEGGVAVDSRKTECHRFACRRRNIVSKSGVGNQSSY